MEGIAKIATTVILSLMLVMAFSTATVVQAELTPADVGAKANATDTTKDLAGVTSMAGRIISIIRNVAVIVGVVVLAILGVKFMLGSAEERAEYKKSFVPLIIGIVVVMGAVQIATMLFSIVQ